MEIIIVLIFLVILIIVTVYIAMQKKDITEDPAMPTIHASGIYSVIRKSPRENIYTAKPTAEMVAELVNSSDKDINQQPLTEKDKRNIIERWNTQLEKNICIVEEGDKVGAQRFLIRSSPSCTPCSRFIEKNYFILREDIFLHPKLIPPYYPGCGCTLESEADWNTALNYEHFVPGAHGQFPLPSWKQVKKV